MTGGSIPQLYQVGGKVHYIAEGRHGSSDGGWGEDREAIALVLQVAFHQGAAQRLLGSPGDKWQRGLPDIAAKPPQELLVHAITI